MIMLAALTLAATPSVSATPAVAHVPNAADAAWSAPDAAWSSEVPVAGFGVTGPPEWFPLRGTWLVGCTWANNCNGHHGRPAIDLATDRFGSGAGAPVYAAGAGQAFVTSRGDGCDSGGGSQGNTVEVDHGGGVRSMYTHLQAVTVTDGDWVGPDTAIGTVGNTGWSSPCTFNHLHFEVMANGVSVDPGPLLGCADGVRIAHPSSQVGGQWATVAQWTPMTNDGPACAVPVDAPPIGSVDSLVASADRTLRISGWVFDPDDPHAGMVVAVRWRGPVGGVSGMVPVTSAAVVRTDVAGVHPDAPVDAGFELAVTVPSRVRSVEVVAVNPTTGETTVMSRHKLSMPRNLPAAPSPEAPGVRMLSWVTGSL